MDFLYEKFKDFNLDPEIKKVKDIQNHNFEKYKKTFCDIQSKYYLFLILYIILFFSKSF